MMAMDIGHARFEVTTAANGNSTLIFSGDLDETVDFHPVLQSLAGATAVSIDTLAVRSLNSPGVKAWLAFVDTLLKSAEISFRALGETFVEQSNIFPMMLGKRGVRVHSIEIPYLCGQCDVRSPELLPTALLEKGPAGLVPPESRCLQCGNAMELDAIPEEYFMFLQYCSL